MEESIKNRNESYEKIKPLGPKQKVVLDLITKYVGLTTHEVADKMRLKTESITGRIKELEQRGCIKAIGRCFNYKTERKNTIWLNTTPEEKKSIVEAKIADLHERAVHLSVDLGNVVSNSAIDLISKELKRIDKKLEILI